MATSTKAPAANAMTPPAGAGPATKGAPAKPSRSKSGKGTTYPAAHSLPADEFARGAGGELHQVAADGQPQMTTNHGMPISDDRNSLKAGPRGPVLLEDFVLREKIFGETA